MGIFLKTIFWKCLHNKWSHNLWVLLKTEYWKCLRFYYSMQYQKYSKKLKRLNLIRFSVIDIYMDDIGDTSDIHDYYQEKVRWCGEKLYTLSFP